jgi:hypothetical protein
MWYLSCEDVISSTIVVCLIAYTTGGITFTTIGSINGSTLLFIIFCAFKYVLPCSFFTLELEAPLSSILFFLLKALLGESVAAFFLFFNVVYISSLVLLTLAGGLHGLSF